MKNPKTSKIDNIDREIIRLKLSYPGISIEKIAREIGRERRSISVRLNKPEVQEILTKAKQSALDILLEAQPAAARRLRKEITNEDSDIAIKACREILKGVLHENVNVKVEKNDLIKFLETLEQADVERMLNVEK